MFRLSSDIVPFGSHPVNTVPWWDEFAEPLAHIGELIRTSGMRVSMHPGQYTVLSSPDPRIVEAARADLVFHARLLDALGPGHAPQDRGPCRRRVLRQGGSTRSLELRRAQRSRMPCARGWCSKTTSACLARRMCSPLPPQPECRSCSTSCTTACTRVHVPTMRCRTSCGAPRAPGDTERDGVPKIHYSSQAAGLRPGAHAEYVEPTEFADFLALAPADVEFDCMLEAKAKDLALFRVRDALGIAA